MISLNYSLFVEIILFLAMVVFLQRFLFRPLLQLWDERDELIEGNKKKAEELSKHLDSMIVFYEAQLWAARKLAAEEQEKIRRTAASEQEELVTTAKNEALETIADLREQIALEYREALKRVEAGAEGMGKSIAEQILGKTVAG